ncbi:hypothetical protein [Actinoplanes sp. NPDC049802]
MIRGEDGESTVLADGEPGQVTVSIRRQLAEIQRGLAEDPFGWVHRIF